VSLLCWPLVHCGDDGRSVDQFLHHWLADVTAELFGDRSGGHEFVALVKELAGPGVLQGGLHPFKFSFPRVEMPYESYDGINARCRYYVRVTVSRASYASSNITKDLEFAVRNVEPVRVGLACCRELQAPGAASRSSRTHEQHAARV